jgi:hypothetical protein
VIHVRTGEGSASYLGAAVTGRYRIEYKLGEGGMASVSLAEDLRHERKVPKLAGVGEGLVRRG